MINMGATISYSFTKETHNIISKYGPSACPYRVLRQREKAFYYDAREAHYIRFGPRAWFDPDMRGRNSHHF